MKPDQQQLSKLARAPGRSRGTLLIILLAFGALVWLGVRMHSGSGELVSPLEWHNDVDAARAAAGRAGLPILAVFTSPTCVHCDRLKAGVLSSDEFAEAADGRVVPALLDISDSRHRKLLDEFGSNYVPTVVLMDSGGELLAMFRQTPDRLPAWIVAVLHNERIIEPATQPAP